MNELKQLCVDGDAHACFALASKAGDEDLEMSEAANWRACELAYVPEACALFLQFQLSTLENRDLLSPKQLLHIVEAACSYQNTFCVLVDDALKNAALGDIRGQFPETVGGFAFGDTKQTAKSDCLAPGGSWADDGADVAACKPVPVEPFPFGKAAVRLQFCSGSLCEIALIFPEQSHIVGGILDKLRAKYGEAAPSTPATVCASSTQALAGGDQPFRWTWTDRRPDHTARQIVYDFSCTQGDSVPSSPTIWYRNVAGTLRRLDEYGRRRSNY